MASVSPKAWGGGDAVATHSKRAVRGASALPDLSGFGNPEELMAGWSLGGGLHPGVGLGHERQRSVSKSEREMARNRRAVREEVRSDGGAPKEDARWTEGTLRHFEKHQNSLKSFA